MKLLEKLLRTYAKAGFYLLALLFLNQSCEKPAGPDKLPPLTANGANTFGCKFNGVVYVAQDYVPTVGSITRGSDKMDGCYVTDTIEQLYLAFHSNRFGPFYFFIREPRVGINYFLFNGNKSVGDTGTNYGHLRTVDYKSWYGNLSFIRVDTANSIFSGTFDAVLMRAANDPSSIKVTEGRFDVNLKTLPQTNCRSYPF